MSLIHQALKKIESARTSYNPPAEFAPPQKANPGRGRVKLLIAGVLAAVLIPAVFAVYSFRTILTKAEKAALEDPGLKELKENMAPRAEPAEMDMALEHNKKGVTLFKSLQMTGAEAEFKEALRLKPEDPVYYNNLGLVYSSLERRTEAEELFKQAISIKPDYAEALNNYGALLDKKGDTKTAVEQFKRALKIRPDYHDALLNMAVSHERRMNYKEAVAYYEKFIEVSAGEPFAEEVKEKVMRLRAGLILKESKDRKSN